MSNWQKCIRCKEPFMLHPETDAALQRSGHTFHCPWGHPQVYAQGPTEAEKLRQQLAEAEKRVQTAKQNEAYYEDRLRAETTQREYAQNQARAYKGVATRVKNRVGKGVCPCCNRTFANLHRHMAGQHPTFAADDLPNHGSLQ